VLKLDIKGFFMHINKAVLFAELQAFIQQKYQHTDKALLIELCRKIIYYAPPNTVSSKVNAAPGRACHPISAFEAPSNERDGNS
jgi:hypothetical protein